MHDKSKGKQVAITSALIGIAAASVKARQHVQAEHSAEASPLKLSKSDWKAVFTGTKDAIGTKNLPTLAAGVAYYATLAFFPFLAAIVAIAALVISTDQLNSLVHAVETYLPADIGGVIITQLQNLVSRRADNALAAGIALAIALFGASGASKGIIIASNVAYGVKESRGWLAQQAWGIAWTILGMICGSIAVGLLAVNATVLGHLGMPGWLIDTLLYGRWLVLLLLSVFGLAVLYRHGPNRAHVPWRWVWVGAGIATLMWLAATSLFFVYLQNFANYTQSYSLFAGIIALMVWMNLSALIALVGAEINHQLEIAGSKKWGGFLPHDD